MNQDEEIAKWNILPAQERKNRAPRVGRGSRLVEGTEIYPLSRLYRRRGRQLSVTEENDSRGRTNCTRESPHHGDVLSACQTVRKRGP